MVRQLRKKFIVTAMSALLVILVVLIAAINIMNHVQSVAATDAVLNELASQGGSFSAFRFDFSGSRGYITSPGMTTLPPFPDFQPLSTHSFNQEQP